MAAATHTDETRPTAASSRKPPQRSCAVTREVHDRNDLLRFVAGPDGMIVPDIKATLPGRGVWLLPRRSVVEQAVSRKAFARSLKRGVETPSGLAETVDTLLADAALGALGFARKAGQCLSGAGKVESAARSARAIALLHASDGAEDGLRKLRQWALAGAYASTGPQDDDDEDEDGELDAEDGSPPQENALDVLRPFTTSQLSLALGATHVIHAAIMQGGAGRNALARISKLVAYREI